MVAARLARTAEHVAPRKRQQYIGKYGFELAKQLRAVPGADRDYALDPAVILPSVELVARVLGIDTAELGIATDLAWPQVDHPGDALILAHNMARAFPILLVGALRRYERSRFQTFASLAYWLDHDRRDRGGDDSGPLPRKEMGALLGVHWSRVSDYVALAKRVRLIECVDPNYRYDIGVAQLFRFNLTCPHYRRPGEESS